MTRISELETVPWTPLYKIGERFLYFFVVTSTSWKKETLDESIVDRVLILDGDSEHVAQACRKLTFLKICFTALDLNKCLKQIK